MCDDKVEAESGDPAKVYLRGFSEGGHVYRLRLNFQPICSRFHYLLEAFVSLDLRAFASGGSQRFTTRGTPKI